MPNPTGQNNFSPYAAEPAYGQATQLDQLKKSAAMPDVPALNAPRRAQKATQKGRGAPVEAPAPLPAPGEVNPQFSTAQAWAEIAATPGASPLIQSISAQAQSG